MSCRQSDSDNTVLDASLADWLYSVQPDIGKLREHLQHWHHRRGETCSMHASERVRIHICLAKYECNSFPRNAFVLPRSGETAEFGRESK